MTRGRFQRFRMLFHHRWAVPILAELHRGAGAKFVTLVNRLGISRDSLRLTLDVLIEQGWVVRNPGHGHPMRPEYILTANARRLAPWCHRLMAVIAALHLEDVALRKWSMPVALALRAGRARFSEVKAFMPGVTARALALSLKNLQAAGLVERVVSAEYPPGSYYQLTGVGRRLEPLLDAF